MKKALKITGIVIVSVVVVAMLALLGFKAYDAIKYNSFYSGAEKEFVIPGLKENYVPQGFDYLSEKDLFLACGYMSDGTASRVYVIDKYGNSTCTELKDKYGADYTGHTGGVAYYQDYLYITGSDGVDVFTLSDVLDGKKETFLKGTIKTGEVNPAYCFIYDGELFVGAFHKDGDYNTPESHHIVIDEKTGETNRALMLTYKLSTETGSTFGVEPQPKSIYSMPSYVQGVYIYGEAGQRKMIVSTSWGLTTSKLYIHDFEKIAGENCAVSTSYLFGQDNPLPMYKVRQSTLVDTISAPPMAEEIVYYKGKIWVMNESACNKYIFGKITTGNYLFSYEY